MKRAVLGIVITVLVIAIGYPLALAGVLFASPPPPFVGTGQLASCPPTPNCVSSLSADNDRYVMPIQYEGEVAVARQALLQALQALPRTSIMAAEDDYIHAVSRSPMMRFVDDMEFTFDDNLKVINVRAAARLGESDLGANRNRVEQLRDLFNEAVS